MRRESIAFSALQLTGIGPQLSVGKKPDWRPGGISGAKEASAEGYGGHVRREQPFERAINE
jgi:hypothetical protein